MPRIQTALVLMVLALFPIPHSLASDAAGFQRFLEKERQAYEEFQGKRSGVRAPEVKPATAHRARTTDSAITTNLAPENLPASIGGPDGARLTLSDGMLSGPVSITLALPEDSGAIPIHDGRARTLAAVRLTFTPATLLAAPAELVLSPSPEPLAAGAALTVQEWQPSSGAWSAIPFRYDAARRSVMLDVESNAVIRCVDGAWEARPPATARSGGIQAAGSAFTAFGSIVFAWSFDGYNALWEWVALDTSSSPRFTAIYDAAAVKADPRVGDAVWKRHPFASTDPAIPHFIADTLYHAEQAFTAYAEKLPCPPTPIGIKVNAFRQDLPGMSMRCYDAVHNRVYIGTRNKEESIDRAWLQYGVAHEVFHAFQLRQLGHRWGLLPRIVLDDFLWWTESTADYAARQWFQSVGPTTRDKTVEIFLLQEPLSGSGKIRPRSIQEMEYQKWHFIAFLDRQPRLDFTAAMHAVAARGDRPQAVLANLDAYVRDCEAGSLAEVYLRYAAHFWFSEDPPHTQLPTHDNRLNMDNIADASVSIAAARLAAGDATTCSLALKKGYTLGLWQVQVTGTNAPMPLTISVSDSGGAITGAVYVIRGNHPVKEPAVPVATLAGLASANVLLNPEDTLYVALLNTSLVADSKVTVTLERTRELLPVNVRYRFASMDRMDMILTWEAPSEPLLLTEFLTHGLRAYIFSRSAPLNPVFPVGPVFPAPDGTGIVPGDDLPHDILFMPPKSWLGLASVKPDQRGLFGPVYVPPIAWAEQDPSTNRVFWDADGQRLREEYGWFHDFAKGFPSMQGSYKAWHGNGTLDMEGRYLEDQPDGTWRRWWPDGSLRNESAWKGGLPHGAFLANQPSGTPLIRGQYDLGRVTGAWQAFFADGTLRARIEATPSPDLSGGHQDLDLALAAMRERMDKMEIWDDEVRIWKGEVRIFHPDGRPRETRRYADGIAVERINHDEPEEEGTFTDTVQPPAAE